METRYLKNERDRGRGNVETVRVEQSRLRAVARQDREHGSQVARAAERKGKYWYARWVLSGRPSQERWSGRGRKTSGEERGRSVLHRAGPRCIPPFTAIRAFAPTGKSTAHGPRSARQGPGRTWGEAAEAAEVSQHGPAMPASSQTVRHALPPCRLSVRSGDTRQTDGAQGTAVARGPGHGVWLTSRAWEDLKR